MYKLTLNGVQRLSDEVWIPEAPTNKDWQEYQAWLGDGNTPRPADDAPPLPDGNGFIGDIKTALGGIVGANALMMAYPAFLPAIQQMVWADAQVLILDAHQKGVLSDPAYAAFKSAAAAHHIPVVLP